MGCLGGSHLFFPPQWLHRPHGCPSPRWSLWAVGSHCFFREEVRCVRTISTSRMGCFSVPSFQSPPVSTDPAILGSSFKSVGLFFSPLGQKGHDHLKRPSGEYNPPALVTPAILHICLIVGCSSRTRERREIFRQWAKLLRTHAESICPAPQHSEGSLSSATASLHRRCQKLGEGPQLAQGLRNGTRVYYAPWGHQRRECLESRTPSPNFPLTSHKAPEHNNNSTTKKNPNGTEHPLHAGTVLSRIMYLVCTTALGVHTLTAPFCRGN